MKISKRTRTLAIAAAAAAAMAGGPASRAADQPDLTAAIAAGHPILELRPRYELVDQDGFARDADAFTLRTRLGWETGGWRGLKALAEMEDVRAIGGQRFNSGQNGRTGYPVIADPDVTELNRAQLSWSGPGVGAVIGRQAIDLDDQRFIGTVGWRQDDQTFDAARLDSAFGPVRGAYIYLDRVNRVGRDQDWDADGHAVNLTWTAARALAVEGFLYALDFKQAPAASSFTWGVRATGVLPAGPVKLAWAAAVARQHDYRNSPGRFDLGYWQAELAASHGPWTLKGSYEHLGGDGARGFSTPLATLHAFQGWADVFLTTPADGVDDAGVTLQLKPPLRLAHLSGPVLTAVWHDFRAPRTDAGLGREWDLMASARIAPGLTGLVKYARYRGPDPARAPFASRSKLWLQLDYGL
jgi:hypothetical protein